MFIAISVYDSGDDRPELTVEYVGSYLDAAKSKCSNGNVTWAFEDGVHIGVDYNRHAYSPSLWYQIVEVEPE